MSVVAFPVIGLLSLSESQSSPALAVLAIAAVAVAVFGILVVVTFSRLGRVASRDRDEMARRLSRLLASSRLAVAAILVAQGVLALGLVIAFIAATVDAGVARAGASRLLVAAPILVYGWAAYRLVTRRDTTLASWPVEAKALTVSPELEPRLFAEIEAVAKSLGVVPPAAVIAGFDPRFFMVGTRVQALDGEHGARTLHLPLTAMAILTRAEFRAAIAHELAHFVDGEATYSEVLSPARAAPNSLARSSRLALDGGSIPIAALLGPMLVPLVRDFSTLRRQREFDADRRATAATSGLDLASAIVKLTRAAPVWQSAWSTFTVESRQGQATEPLIDAFVRRALELAPGTDRVHGAIEHPLDEIPVTADRLNALGVPSADRRARDLSPAEPALGLFRDPVAFAGRLEAQLGAVAR